MKYQRLRMSDNVSIPQAEVTDCDPFAVAPQPPLWQSLCIFILTLPLTILSFGLLAFLGGIGVLVYRGLRESQQDRLARFIGSLLLVCSRIRLTVCDYSEGHQAQLYIGNHISMMEGIMLIRVVGHVRFLAASFSKDIPLFGALVRVVDPIFVNRRLGGNQYTKQIMDSLENTPLRHVIFPEGAYENGQALLRFKSGAFVAGQSVTPILFEYPNYVPYWNRKESSFLAQLYRYTSRFYTPVKMSILPIYNPSDAEIEDPKVYAESIRQLMSYHLKTPVSEKDIFSSPNYQADVEPIR